ncbi:hypothetical protein conserved [Entamoeba histolytica]|uniref:Uncharacterized protein n=3 Tax=Entamoeba histolytica TaxID=5759 RepID=C4M4T1_ENTH1|nr:hypothetical protein EHI_095190 [Entamoeba histolytica HM-1:IMSS]EAL43250.2 hypothetical protein EHI_095190 [Entamoeba histolytica HM-1:IMSS]GAT96388.1 hypothetical protein conserved [Entamoeba histolytica]|eukprot:XP_648637.2 hypothetical protein EHI_095190 [Entamoeba histolytica HM-1:IMSS]
MWVSIVLIFILAGIMALGILFKYINPLKTRWYVVLCSFVGWYLAFLSPLLMPLDIVSTFRSEKDFLYINQNVLIVIWWIIYILQFGLCYLIFPIVQTYSIVGDFTFIRKLIRSIKRNVIFYGTLIMLLIIFFILFWFFKGDELITSGQEYFGFALTLSNAWGLILAIGLMGNGYIMYIYDTIRTFTNKLELRKNICDVGLCNIRMTESKKVLEEQIKVIKGYDEIINEEDPLRPYVNKCVNDIKRYYNEKYETSPSNKVKNNYTELAISNEKLQDSLRKIIRDEKLYEKTITKTKQLFLIENETDIPELIQEIPKIKYYYYKYGRWFTNIFKTLLILIFWIFIIQPELTMIGKLKTINPTINITSSLLNNDLSGWVGVETLIILSLMIFFAFSSFINIEMISFFRITKHQLSDSYSIIFAGNYLSRVGPALAMNFIHMINFTSNQYSNIQTQTAFQIVNKGMEKVPFFGRNSFNDTFPMCIFCIMVLSALFIGIDYRKVFNFVVGLLNYIFSCVDGIGIDEIIYTSENESYKKGVLLIKKRLLDDSKNLPESESKRNYRKSVMSIHWRVNKNGYNELRGNEEELV